jgi:hypothetical protein
VDKEPDIKLSGRTVNDNERICSLYEYKIEEDIAIFKYRYSDWSDYTSDAYFSLYEGVVYYDRDYPSATHRVVDCYRDYAYSNKEIKTAIEHYLIEKVLLESYA